MQHFSFRDILLATSFLFPCSWLMHILARAHLLAVFHFQEVLWSYSINNLKPHYVLGTSNLGILLDGVMFSVLISMATWASIFILFWMYAYTPLPQYSLQVVHKSLSIIPFSCAFGILMLTSTARNSLFSFAWNGVFLNSYFILVISFHLYFTLPLPYTHYSSSFCLGCDCLTDTLNFCSSSMNLNRFALA